MSVSQPELQTKATVSRNYWCNVMDGALFCTAMALVPVMTILPAYVKKFTDNEFLVNSITALFVLGFTAPQVLMARHVESLERRKPLMLLTGLLQRLPWLFLAIAALIDFGGNSTLPLILFFLFFSLFTFSSGFNIPVWLDLLGKLTPQDKVGRLMATRETIGLTLAIGGSALSIYILAEFPFPTNYSLLFFLFFLITMVSLGFLCFLDEHPSEDLKIKPSLITYLRGIPPLLRSDRNYRRYVIASCIAALGAMQGGLVTAWGIDTFELENRDWILANISMVNSIIAIATIYLFGRMGDLAGHKINLMLSALFIIISMTILIFTQHLLWFAASFVFIQLANNANMVSRSAIILQFSKPCDRPTYISVQSTIAALFAFLAPFAGAAIAQQLGYRACFAAVIAIKALFLIYMGVMVTEPRKAPLVTTD